MAYGRYSCLLQCIEVGGPLTKGVAEQVYDPYIPILACRYPQAALTTIVDSAHLAHWFALANLPHAPVIDAAMGQLRALQKQRVLDHEQPTASPDRQSPDGTLATTQTWSPEHWLTTLTVQAYQLKVLTQEFLTEARHPTTVTDTASNHLERDLNRWCPLVMDSTSRDTTDLRTRYLLASWHFLQQLWQGTPMEQLTQALCFVPWGAVAITALALNYPDQLTLGIDGILRVYPCLPLKSQFAAREAIQALCKAAPHRTKAIRDRLTHFQVLPEVALKITLHFDPERLSYLSAFFDPTLRWVATPVSSCYPFVHELKRRIYDDANSAVAPGLKPHPGLSPDRAELFFRVLGCFACVLLAPIEDMDVEFLRTLIPGLTAPVADVCLAYLLASFNPARVNANLLALLSDFKQAPIPNHSLYLMAIFLRTHEYDRVDSFIRSSLRIATPLGQDRLYPVRERIVQHVVTDAELAHYITDHPDLAHHVALQPSLHLCVHNLLKHGILQKHRVDIRPWIYDQIAHADTPPQTHIVALIKEYVESIFQHPSITAIPEDAVKAVWADPQGATTPSCVLMAFYLLYYSDYLAQSFTQGASGTFRDRLPYEYSDSLIDALPIRPLLATIANEPERAAYRDIYPELVALSHYQAPELFDVKSTLIEQYCTQAELPLFGALHRRIGLQLVQDLRLPVAAPLSSWADTVDALVPALRDPHQCYAALRYLAQHSPQRLASVAPVIIKACLPRYLETQFPPKAVQQFRVVWEKIHQALPRDVEVWTVNQWWHIAGDAMEQRDSRQHSNAITVQDLWMDPLRLFQCHPQVFQHPDFFAIFLQILGIYSVMSRHKLRAKYAQKAHSTVLKFKDQHLSAMLYLQDTAILQALLDLLGQSLRFSSASLAIPAATLSAGTRSAATPTTGMSLQFPGASSALHNLPTAVTVQRLTCEFLNQCFINNKLVCKLLVFQTFDPVTLPFLVDHVPSLHIGLEFVSELLAQPFPEKQVFGLQLAATLLQKYPMAKHLALAREVLLGKIWGFFAKPSQPPPPSSLSSLSSAPASTIQDANLKFLYPALDALLKIAHVFPTLIPECKTIAQFAQTAAAKASTMENSNASGGHPSGAANRLGGAIGHNGSGNNPTSSPLPPELGASSIDEFKNYVGACLEALESRPRH
ncbi:hypothetical protein H4R35_000904 [Dimargaris xerosporica]|nr:hypothetical protein H4R35_000904 [Dimargaris xerosporica]